MTDLNKLNKTDDANRHCSASPGSRIAIGDSCPICGTDVEIDTPVFDGDLWACPDCDFACGITVNEDGSAYLQD
jgi:hypothetical protein